MLTGYKYQHIYVTQMTEKRYLRIQWLSALELVWPPQNLWQNLWW